MFCALSMWSCIMIITILPLLLFTSLHSLSSFHSFIHWTNAFGHLLYHSAAHSDGKAVVNSGIGDEKGIKDYSFEDFLLERDLESTLLSPLTFRHQVSSLIIWYDVTFLRRNFWEHFNRIFPNLVKNCNKLVKVSKGDAPRNWDDWQKEVNIVILVHHYEL